MTRTSVPVRHNVNDRQPGVHGAMESSALLVDFQKDDRFVSISGPSETESVLRSLSFLLRVIARSISVQYTII